ncbi:putative mitochondrial import protein TIM15 [Helianthus annuus]|nr:putative mitochondrial import protein TIM15 [Helianthus annuus]KAJ0687797.1 putative mitochondrial import protein TIM15 [Helianthus annuus]
MQLLHYSLNPNHSISPKSFLTNTSNNQFNPKIHNQTTHSNRFSPSTTQQFHLSISKSSLIIRIMETLASSASIVSSLSIFYPKSKPQITKRRCRFSIASKNDDNEFGLRSESNDASIVPISSNQSFSKDDAMGLVLSAANVRGWTTGSGMEGPPVSANGGCGGEESSTHKISTFPWSLFTKSPRRRMRVAFTCNVCGQRTTRAINPHAYTDGTVFVQCCGCNVFHKLVDNLNLFHEMKCYVNQSFNYQDPNGNATTLGFKYLDMDDENDNLFPLL